jgi:hypothetical protein
LFLLIRWAQRARCQAETPLIVLCRFPQPALQEEGAASFDKSWNDLMACIEAKSAVMRKAS